RVIIKNALASIAYHTVPLRRFGGSSLARIAILFVGLTAMSADTVPFLHDTASAWLIACLWGGLALFPVGVRMLVGLSRLFRDRICNARADCGPRQARAALLFVAVGPSRHRRCRRRSD